MHRHFDIILPPLNPSVEPRPSRGMRTSRLATVLILALCACSILALSACASDTFRPGLSDAPMLTPSTNASAKGPAAGRWEHFNELGSMRLLAPTFPSRGHGTGELNAELRANDTAAAAIENLQPGRQMPAGSLLVLLHTQRGTSNADEAFVMEKRSAGYWPGNGDWDYAVADARGVLQSRGKLELCARCHAEAPADFVFKLPKQ